MKPRLKEEEERKPETAGCSHYWIIEVANGPTSLGKCKHCGEEREFFNAFPEYSTMKRRGNPLDLPKLSGVKVDKESKS